MKSFLSFLLTISLCLCNMALLGSCTGTGRNEYYACLLDSARQEMGRMNYAKAEAMYEEVVNGSHNELFHLTSYIGLMKICQLRSLNREFIDNTTKAEHLIEDLQSSEIYMDKEGLETWQRALSEFKTVRVVYYLNIGDFDKVYEITDIKKPTPARIDKFRREYLGESSMYYKSLRKVNAAASLTDSGRYADALDSLGIALHYINAHHIRYGNASKSDTLVAYDDSETPVSTEMTWIQNAECICLPEWIATIREQYSITYGAMGEKAASDYNHNLYFDILDATRQDMQMEQHLEVLQTESHTYIIITIASVLLFAVMCIVLGNIYRRKKREFLEKSQTAISTIDEMVSNSVERLSDSVSEQTVKITDTLEMTCDDLRATEMRIEENKRGYIDKAASVAIANGIIPFLDRAIHEAERLSNPQYLAELIDRIITINDVLGHWVKIRKGSVSLNIESFRLSDLFDIMAKAKNIYEKQGLTLNVEPTDAVVKADKALTLFMINTLMDNARKFTPEGGSVSIYATRLDNCVEISVRDTGLGMVESDMREAVIKKKGHGFGLMNCRGIIEKYKKTSKMFEVSLFDVESKPGQGSRFFFRLPLSLRKAVTMIALLFSCANVFAAGNATNDISRARQYADSVFYCNTVADYRRAILFGDSALQLLNHHYTTKTGETEHLLHLESDITDMPEVRLWQNRFDTDYDLIIVLRNEISIAALALNQRHLYKYNAAVLTRMYQLLAQDETLSQQIAEQEKSNNNMKLILGIFIITVLVVCLLQLMYCYRTLVLPLFNYRQVQRLHDKLLTTPTSSITPQLYSIINDIVSIDGICIAITDEDNGTLQMNDYSHERFATEDLSVQLDTLHRFVNYVHDNGETMFDAQTRIVCLPLIVRVPEGEDANLGVLGILLRSRNISSDCRQSLHWIAQLLAAYYYNNTKKIADLQTELELKTDELNVAEAEKNRIYVQNMILDNCLSTIKHETMYYPSRIKDLISRRNTADDTSALDHDIHEMLCYYKEVFSILSQCAMKQLEKTMFRRRTFAAGNLLQYAQHLADQLERKHKCGIQFHATQPAEDIQITGDIVMLQYLISSLLTASFSRKQTGTIAMSIEPAGNFCQFTFTDNRRQWTSEEMHTLFHAETLKYDEQSDSLAGAEFIIARQIIREHDEHCSPRGCRIYAADSCTIVFTIPMKR